MTNARERSSGRFRSVRFPLQPVGKINNAIKHTVMVFVILFVILHQTSRSESLFPINPPIVFQLTIYLHFEVSHQSFPVYHHIAIFK